MKVKLTHITENPVLAIEEAASNCYDSEPTEDGRIMRACFRSGHHSVLEFAQFTFHIEGVSRALLAQLTRHRHASFAVRSQRYCSEDGAQFVVPPTVKNNLKAWEVWSRTIGAIEGCYKALQEAGVPNEDARFILPNACETTLELSVNGRELIHICEERCCNRAQWEIKKLAWAMVAEVKKQCPEFAKLLGPKCDHLGYCPEYQSCGRKPKKKEVFDAYNKTKEDKIDNSEK